MRTKVVKVIVVFTVCNFFLCFSSCNNNPPVENKIQTTDSITKKAANDTIEDKEKVQEITSFDFIDKFRSDNFFKDDMNSKTILLTNLIVDGYEIDNNGSVKLYCLAYSPEKSLVYLSDLYRMAIYSSQSKSNIDTSIDESVFQVGSKRLSWVKHGRFDGDGPRFLPDMQGFLIVLDIPKTIKELSCYNGALSDFNTIKNYYATPNCKYTDVINVKGTFKKESHFESSSEHCCPKFIFEGCTYTKQKINS